MRNLVPPVNLGFRTESLQHDLGSDVVKVDYNALGDRVDRTNGGSTVTIDNVLCTDVFENKNQLRTR